MHDAYDLTQLLRLTVHIESIAACDDILFLGTKLGHLLIYSVNKKLGEHRHDVQLLGYNKHFSKKSILQLEVIPQYQVLVSLSDNVVSFHNFHKVSAQTMSTAVNATVLQDTQGASRFTLDNMRETSLTGDVSYCVRLCVVVKRKLQFYYWKNGEFLELEKEITVPDIPRAVLLCQGVVAIGNKHEYSLLNILDKTFQKLFPIGAAPEPIITPIARNVFALGRDAQCILMNSSGDLTLKYAVKWAEFPTCVIYDKPYLIGLLPEVIEVRTIEPNQFIQTLPCPKANLVARGRSGLVYIAKGSTVWCLQSVPVPQQLQTLVLDKQFELALKLAIDREDDCEEEQKKKVLKIQTLYAHHLFSAKQYQESMSQFLTLGTNPYEVIKLFPDFLPTSSPRPSQPKLTDSELDAGLSALIDYLTEVRRRGLTTNKPAWLSIVDTTLLKCYLQTNDAMVAPLLRLNMVHFNEAETVLKKHNKMSELVMLYQNNGLHGQALALLKQQNNLEKTVDYLQHLGTDKLPLLLEYAEWVIQENPEEALKIFVEDTTEMEQLPRPQILNFLIRTCKKLAIPYLEHAIKVWKDTNPILHTTLVNLYRERYEELQGAPECKQEAMKLREKLLEFLEQSDHYSPQVLDLFPKTHMLEERAIMLGKQGRHEQALSIYVCMLEDVQRAKQYCERVVTSKAPGHDEVYVLLMRILISPPENWLLDVSDKPPPIQRDLTTAVEVLLSNPEKINPSQALSILPDDLPLRDIRPFLEASLRGRLNTRRNTQIKKSLVYSEHLQVQDLRMRSEARPVLITELHICVICSKRFTSQSVFALIPAGVVHYGCLKDKPNI